MTVLAHMVLPSPTNLLMQYTSEFILSLVASVCCDASPVADSKGRSVPAPGYISLVLPERSGYRKEKMTQIPVLCCCCP